MKLKIHRGTNQIGGNIVEVATDTTKIMLDCGQNLPPLDDPKAEDNIDIPGLTSGKNAFDAVFISHHHGDHCGLLGRINDEIKVYMSEITKNVLEITADFVGKPAPSVHKVLVPRNPESIGDITVTPLPVKHSAWGAMMFLVQSGETKLLYTGDFNDIDEDDYKILENIDILLCEGTNVKANRNDTEDTVQTDAKNIMEQTKGDVFVLCSTTNLNRVKAIDAACLECNPPRKMVFDTFMNAILQNVDCKLESKTLQFLPHSVIKGKNRRMEKYIAWAEEDALDWRTYTGAANIAKRKNLTFMVRPTMEGFLIRLGGHKVGIEPPEGKQKDYLEYRASVIAKKPFVGSTLIYSIWRGYENTGQTAVFLDFCRSLGMDVEYLHVSGHAYREQLESSVVRLNPKILVPIHTENPENYHEFKGMRDKVIQLNQGEILDCVNGVVIDG